MKTKRKELTGDVTMVGVPYLVNDKTILVEGIHSRFNGVYYIEEVSHRIEESFVTNIRLNKHGIRRLDEPDPNKANKPKPPVNNSVDATKQEKIIDNSVDPAIVIGQEGYFKGTLNKKQPNYKQIDENNLDNNQK